MNRFGYDDTNGIVIGPMSYRYEARFELVEYWPKHNERIVRYSGPHHWTSHKVTKSEAIAELIALNYKESELGDGSPCITKLEQIK